METDHVFLVGFIIHTPAISTYANTSGRSSTTDVVLYLIIVMNQGSNTPPLQKHQKLARNIM